MPNKNVLKRMRIMAVYIQAIVEAWPACVIDYMLQCGIHNFAHSWLRSQLAILCLFLCELVSVFSLAVFTFFFESFNYQAPDKDSFQPIFFLDPLPHSLISQSHLHCYTLFPLCVFWSAITFVCNCLCLSGYQSQLSTQCCKVFPSDPSSCATFTLQQHQWIVFYCFLICLYNCNRCFRHQKFLVLIPAQNKAHSNHHIVVVFFKVMYIVESYFLCFELHHVFAWSENFVFLYSVFATGARFWCASKLCLLVSVFISSKCHFSHFKEEIEKGPMSNKEPAPQNQSTNGGL